MHKCVHCNLSTEIFKMANSVRTKNIVIEKCKLKSLEFLPSYYLPHRWNIYICNSGSNLSEMYIIIIKIILEILKISFRFQILLNKTKLMEIRTNFFISPVIMKAQIRLTTFWKC